MKRILVLCLVVLMMAGCAKEEKTVNRAVFAWEGVEEADEQLLENYRTKTLTSEIPVSTIKCVSQSISLSDSSIIQDAENPCMRINVGRCVLTSMEDKGDVFSELYVENLDNQFEVLKQETLDGVKNTWKKRYPSGYQRMLSVMDTALTIQVTNYILGNVPKWISNDIRQGVCHFLVKEGKLYWVRRRRTE